MPDFPALAPWPRAALAAAIVAAAATLTACSTPPSPAHPMPHSASHSFSPSQQTLQAYVWTLTKAHNAQGQAVSDWQLPNQSALQLHFAQDTVSVQQLCNTITAGYAVDGQRLTLSRSMSTLMACSDRALMALEQRVGGQISQIQRYTVKAQGDLPVLGVHFADGTHWELLGHPTPATRYGSAGERIFMEVAPTLVPCNHPLMRDAQCMRVRDVVYDANGIRRSVGEWRIFQGQIEGYQHTAGTRNVLRLQRYSLARNGQLPADAPSHAYVLDMVVESGRAD